MDDKHTNEIGAGCGAALLIGSFCLSFTLIGAAVIQFLKGLGL